MTSLNLSLSSPTTSSGYGSEEDHSPIFRFPALVRGSTGDRCPASPSSDQVTSRVSGGSKFNELEEEEEDDDDVNIDIFGEICEYLELDEDGLLLEDCIEIPTEFSSNSAKVEGREPAQDIHGKNLIRLLPRGVRSLSEKNINSRNQTIPLTTEAGDRPNYHLAEFSVTPQNSIVNQCSNHTALKLSINPCREEISEDFLLETSGQCTADPNRSSEYSKGSIPGPDNHHISSSTGIGEEENPVKPRHQSRQNTIRLVAGNQRRKPVNQNETPPTSPPDKRKRRTHPELDDHRYFISTPRNEDQLPVKVPKTSLDPTGSRVTGSGSSRRSEKSILETFLLTKETLNANKGSDGMLAEDNIARLYTGDQDSSRPASSSTSTSTSVLERILLGTSRNLPGAFASEQRSSTATPIDSPGGDKEPAAAAPPSELDINYEIFNDNNCKYDSNSILLEFFCEKLDDEVWTPSGDNGKVFSNEMDAIINSQTPNNQNDVWIHQYISDLL